MRLLLLAAALLAAVAVPGSAMACRTHSGSVQMLFDTAPENPPDGTRLLHGRFTNQGAVFEQVRSTVPLVDVEGDFDAPLLGILDLGDGRVVGVYEVLVTSCNWLFGRDRVFDLDAWVVGRPLLTGDGATAIDPVGRRPTGEWTEF